MKIFDIEFDIDSYLDELEAMQRMRRAKARRCTCHPDDNPPTSCQKKYALQDCIAAAKLSSGGT